MEDFKIQAVIVKGTPPLSKGGNLNLKLTSHYVDLITNKLRGYKGGILQVFFSDAESWTEKMNNLFHALVRDIQKSGQAPYWNRIHRPPQTFEEVKAWVKIELGGAEVKHIGELTWIQSWTAFNKPMALSCINSTIDYCLEVGIEIDSRILERDSLTKGV
jgi:hypothetical protein